MNLGLVYQLQSRNSEAMQEFRTALKLKPTLAELLFPRSRLLQAG